MNTTLTTKTETFNTIALCQDNIKTRQTTKRCERNSYRLDDKKIVDNFSMLRARFLFRSITQQGSLVQEFCSTTLTGTPGLRTFCNHHQAPVLP